MKMNTCLGWPLEGNLTRERNPTWRFYAEDGAFHIFDSIFLTKIEQICLTKTELWNTMQNLVKTLIKNKYQFSVSHNGVTGSQPPVTAQDAYCNTSYY